MPKYIEVELIKDGQKQDASFILNDKDMDVENLFDGSEVGTSYLLTHVEMTEEEFSQLPEFEGF